MISEKELDELLTEMGYDPDLIAKKGEAIGRMGIKFLQEQQNHYYTRLAWEETSKQRDSLKDALTHLVEIITNDDLMFPDFPPLIEAKRVLKLCCPITI